MLVKTNVYGKRIGLMGGTFDPIHYGHLMLAEQIRTSFQLDYILFIPVGQAPHKKTAGSADKFHRLEMVRLATHSHPNFMVSDIEVCQECTTYTIDTVRKIRETLSEHDELFFITGADAIILLETWKDFESLMQMVTFIGATRPGINETDLELKIEELKAKYQASIKICKIPALAISSTDIRNRIANGLSIDYLLPSKVEKYIHQTFIYREHHPDFARLNAYLHDHLSSHRYKHSVETAHFAYKLALIYGCDSMKAEMAGLCHDIAKEYSNDRMLRYISNNQIFLDPCIQNNPNLAHGEVGAIVLKDDFGMTDDDILDAIKWHTYGYKDMSLLSKIIYISDTIEPTRTFEGVNYLRYLAFQDIDHAILAYNQLSRDQKYEQLRHSNTEQMIQTIMKSRMET